MGGGPGEARAAEGRGAEEDRVVIWEEEEDREITLEEKEDKEVTW